MAKLKCWKKRKGYYAWEKVNGVELTSYGQKTTYPFIQVGKYYNSKTGRYEGFEVMRHGTHTSEYIKKAKTKSQAIKFAKSFMRKHDKC